MNVRETVLRSLTETIEEQAQSTPDKVITDETELLNFMLDSLGFASLVTRLENSLGYDPFTSMEFPIYPRTFGELVALYERFDGNEQN
jgi:acyl carrier protein